MAKNDDDRDTIFSFLPEDENEWTRRIYYWAAERNLAGPDNWQNQYVKLIEEVAELGRAFADHSRIGVMDAIGDCQVVLAILAAKRLTSLEECRELAWEQIKNRTGKTVNGVFVKDK